MSAQLELDSVPFQSHSPTSKEAAKSIAPDAATLRGLVYRTLQGHPEGLCDQEIQTLTGLDANTERPRRIELVKLGLAIDSGRLRATRSGRMAVVWEAK